LRVSLNLPKYPHEDSEHFLSSALGEWQVF
jgi:hypothetical protein